MELRQCRQAVVAGLKWMLSEQNADGSFEPAEFGMCAYHKVPYALSLVGQVERAIKLCTWIETKVFTEEGDFEDPRHRQGPMSTYYLYPNAWMALGMHRLELYQMSVSALEFLASLQHPDTGGFLTAGPDAGLDDQQDILSTAVTGLALLPAGYLKAAVDAGRFLVNVFNSQPKVGLRLNLTIEKRDQFVTEYDEEKANAYVITLKSPGQWYFVPGLAALFLVKLYQATGDQTFLNGAQSYVQFAESGADDRYGEARSGFLGLAAAQLYATTGVNTYANIAEAVADNILAAQMRNGSWAEGTMGYEPPAPILDATAENVIVLTGIIPALGE